MPEPFIQALSFYGTQKPYRFEADVYDCEVLGELPAALEGSYFRCGPDDAYPTLGDDIILNGDGMASVFHLSGGKADFRCRYVKTERFLAERNARTRLAGKYRNAFTDAPALATLDRDNTANTTAFWHHGRLYALREDSIPTELDPDTLETRGPAQFKAALHTRTMTAHPKIDPVTGEWWSYGQFCRKEYCNEMALTVLDRQGRVVRQEELAIPYPGVCHDFAVTREHVVFTVMPLTVDVARLKAGGDFYAWDPSLHPMYGVMPRSGTTADIRWHAVPGAMIAHFMNAWSEGNRIFVDGFAAPGNNFAFFKDVDGNPTPNTVAESCLTRLGFDLSRKSGEVDFLPFAGAIGEMPKFDERRAMYPYRYGWHKTYDGLAMVDWQTGAHRVHQLLKTDNPGMAQEPVFVARTPAAAEGDGYIIAVVSRVRENLAELYVLDTNDWLGQPVARVRLPFNLPMSFHGCFVPRAGAQLPR
ncbi:MAG: carotenoid oxygenase family protein [Steroidobacteraceae bacterium]